jgi:hypothetical protein
VFVIVFILLVANLLLSGLNGILIGPVFGQAVEGILSLIILMVFQAYSAAALTVTYYYLRTDKEGVSLDEIAGVFD